MDDEEDAIEVAEGFGACDEEENVERGGKVNDVSVGLAVVAGDPNPLSSKKVDELCASGDCEEEPKSAKSPKSSSSSDGAFAGTLD